MSKRPLIAFLAVLLTAAVISGCAKKEEPKPAAPAAAPAAELSASAVEGKILLGELCTTCHSLDRITSRKESKERWAEIVKTMQGKMSSVLSEESAGKILEYLSTLPSN